MFIADMFRTMDLPVDNGASSVANAIDLNQLCSVAPSSDAVFNNADVTAAFSYTVLSAHAGESCDVNILPRARAAAAAD